MTLPNNPPQTLNYSAGLTPKDIEHLKTLSVCWYVAAALACFGMCVGIIYPIMGVVFLLAPRGGPSGPPPAAMGIIFIAMGVFLLLFSGTMSYLYYLVGKSLKERSGLTLIYVMAGLLCLSVPLGTILGVFTFVVLNRPSVKSAFA